MAVIRPFQGLRYSQETAGTLDALVAPPYDVLTQAERDEYALQSPHNIVHLTLPEQQADDRSKYVKYARSAARLSEWRREGALRLEERPAIYRYTQTFTLPRELGPLTRSAILVLIKTEPYEAGVVLPHEQTFPKHKEDRLRLLEATRAHLESIFGLFEDPDRKIYDVMTAAPAASSSEVQTGTIHHRLEPITDEDAQRHVAALLADKKVWIADGHHRYETACSFRAALGPKDGPVAEDFMMIALSSMSDPGLVLLPTHRILTRLPFSNEDLVQRLGTVFNMETMHSRNLLERLETEEAAGRKAFGLALEGGLGYLMTPQDPDRLMEMTGAGGSQELRSLDVSILHSVVFEGLLGIQGTEAITYTRDGMEAHQISNEGGGAAFLMNPPTIDDMRRVALGGEKMPQKSTFYYPKILSGLVLWSLNDFKP
jgi:uncharacterized protein (DUF1015 family)